MSDTLWSQSLTMFRDAVASDAPTPGGGSVSMVSGSLGLGLVVMALEITHRKQEPGPAADETARLLATARERLAALGRHADEDITVFNAYMTALRMPKKTDEEKAARKSAMQQALEQATRAPLAAAGTSVAALELADEAAGLAGPHVVSDVGAGAALLGGAVTAVLLNVDINLPGLADAALKESFGQERTQLGHRAASLTATVLEKVASRIAVGK